MNKELSKELEEKISNKKAIDFFGEEIVKKLEIQHQDGYPSHFEKVENSSWRYGSTSKYIVELEKQKYLVTVNDNVLTHPLYINVIEDWVVQE